MTRRELLARLAQGAGLVTVGLVGVPALINAFAPVLERRRGAQWQPVGPVETFPLGRVHLATVDLPHRRGEARALREKGVYVWRETPDDLVVFSRHCTDLGCGVIWDPGSEWFFCPCHGGIFAKDGARMAGPPQQPLYRYDHRVRDGILEIDLRSLPPVT